MKRRLSVAYHEAGHAAVALYFRLGVKCVSIVPSPGSAGHVSHFPVPSLLKLDSDSSDFPPRRVEKNMMVALAGGEAQRMFAPSSVRSHHSSQDRETVFAFAFRMTASNEEASALVRLEQVRVRALLGTPDLRRNVRALAKHLMAKAEITGREARQVIEAAEAAEIKRYEKRYPVERGALSLTPKEWQAILHPRKSPSETHRRE